jgi:hypothetical protein
MDGSRFDALVQSHLGSRRSLLAGGLGLAMLCRPAISGAKKKKHKRKKHRKMQPSTPNEFGCLEVDDPCTSDDGCCSSVCEGNKRRRTCRAHHTGTCARDQPGYCAVDNPELVLCNGENGGGGACFRTTAGSNVCSNRFECEDCRRDADCEALGYPSGAACVPIEGDLLCANGCEETGMACVFLTLEA